MIKRKALLSALLLGCMLFLAACGKEVTVPGGNDPNLDNEMSGNVSGIDVSSIALNNTTMNLNFGESHLLVSTVRPYNATAPKVHYTVDNPSVCEIMPSGNNCKVTAVGVGQAVVTATCQGHTATCQFTVTDTVVAVESIEIRGNAEDGITAGTTRQFEAVIMPANATDQTIQWFSSNPRIASVDQNGVITGLVAGGTTVLTAATEDGKIYDQVNLTIVQKPFIPGEDKITRIDLNIYIITMRVEESFRVVATPIPSSATEQGVTFTSTTPEILSVDSNGVVTALAVGKGRICVRSEDGDKSIVRYCDVTVIRA
ncbi:MAG: hypothetical protein E7616_07560 [Ruminococcaceae bacterium]|nr:hypothetical protein [Oscillospiraceae bacterium]